MTVGGKDLSGQGVQCIRCNRVELYTAKIATTKGVPHSMLMKKFTLQGWVYRRKGWECPECLAKDKAARKVVKSLPITGTTTITKLTPAHVAPAAVIPTQPEEKPLSATISDLRGAGGGSPGSAGVSARDEAIAKMTPPDRRRIFREVDDNWNEPKGRYLGAVSDRTIAEKLKVPPVWVETVRRESFGDSADNDEIERLQGEIAKLEGTVQLQIDAALKVAASLETILNGREGSGAQALVGLAAHGHYRWLLTPNADRRKKRGRCGSRRPAQIQGGVARAWKLPRTYSRGLLPPQGPFTTLARIAG